jgi:hypothetical protein
MMHDVGWKFQPSLNSTQHSVIKRPACCTQQCRIIILASFELNSHPRSFFIVQFMHSNCWLTTSGILSGVNLFRFSSFKLDVVKSTLKGKQTNCENIGAVYFEYTEVCFPKGRIFGYMQLKFSIGVFTPWQDRRPSTGDPSVYGNETVRHLNQSPMFSLPKCLPNNAMKCIE